MAESGRALGLEPDDARIALTVQFTPSQWRIFVDALERCRRLAGAEIDEASAIEYMAAELLAMPVEPEEPDSPRAESCTSAQATESDDSREPEKLDDPNPSFTGEREAAPDDPIEAEVQVVAASEPAPIPASLPPGTPADQAFLDALLRAHRRRILERDGWKCTVPGCGERSRLEVDHLKPRARFPELTWNEENQTVLCTGCHLIKTRGLLQVRRTEDGALAFARPDRWGERPPPT